MESTAVKELASLKVKKTTLEDRYRALAAKYDACKAELSHTQGALDTATDALEAAQMTLPVTTRSNHSPPRRAAGTDDGEPEARHILKCFGDWVLVCVTPPRAGSSML